MPRSFQITEQSSLLQQDVDCVYCHADILLHEYVTTCPMCKSPHHVDCWSSNGNQCATFGCDYSGDIVRNEENISEGPIPLGESPVPLSSPKNQAVGWSISALLIILLLLTFSVNTCNSNNRSRSYQPQAPRIVAEFDETTGAVTGILRPVVGYSGDYNLADTIHVHLQQMSERDTLAQSNDEAEEIKIKVGMGVPFAFQNLKPGKYMFGMSVDNQFQRIRSSQYKSLLPMAWILEVRAGEQFDLGYVEFGTTYSERERARLFFPTATTADATVKAVERETSEAVERYLSSTPTPSVKSSNNFAISSATPNPTATETRRSSPGKLAKAIDVQLSDVQYRILEATNEGTSIDSLTAEGEFVAVRLAIANGGSGPLTFAGAKLIDEHGTEYSYTARAFPYTMDEEVCTMVTIAPTEERICTMVYDIDKRATRVSLHLTDLSLLSDESAVIELRGLP